MMDAGVWKSHPSTLLCTDLWEGCQCRGVEEQCRKKVNSVVSNLPAQFFILLREKKRERRGSKNTAEYFSKSPTLFWYQVVLYLPAADFESIGSNR